MQIDSRLPRAVARREATVRGSLDAPPLANGSSAAPGTSASLQLLLGMVGLVLLVTSVAPVAAMHAMRVTEGWSDGQIGQLVTFHAAGCALATIASTLLTRACKRRRVLLVALGVVFAMNLVTALSTNLVVLLMCRLFSGAASGVLWVIVTSSVVPRSRGGRQTLPLSFIGLPMGLSLGVPMVAFFSEHLGWQAAFGLVAALTGAVLMLCLALVPRREAPRHTVAEPSISQLLELPGMVVLLVTAGFLSITHHLVRTFLASFLQQSRMDLAGLLLVQGCMSVVGLVLVERLGIQRLYHGLRLTCLGLAAVMLLLATSLHWSPWTLVAVVALWGMVIGGGPSLVHTAAVRLGGGWHECGHALVVTVWSMSVAVAAGMGGPVADGHDVDSLPWAAAFLALLGVLASLGLRESLLGTVVASELMTAVEPSSSLATRQAGAPTNDRRPVLRPVPEKPQLRATSVATPASAAGRPAHGPARSTPATLHALPTPAPQRHPARVAAATSPRQATPTPRQAAPGPRQAPPAAHQAPSAPAHPPRRAAVGLPVAHEATTHEAATPLVVRPGRAASEPLTPAPSRPRRGL